MPIRLLPFVLGVLLAFFAGCALPPDKAVDVEFSRAAEGTPDDTGRRFDVDAGATAARGARGFEQRGTGRFLGDISSAAVDWQSSEAGDITLNFEAADLREVVKVVLGDILKANYLISQQVGGQITVHTESPVPRDGLLPILESALQLSGAALVSSPRGYLVVPLAEASRFGLSPRALARFPVQPGFRLQAIPLRHVSAEALKPALEPFLPAGATLQVNAASNLFLFAGPAEPLVDFLQTVRLFDTDWLAGMSFGLYPLQQAEAGQVVDELSEVFGLKEDGPLRGVIRLLPIERLNAVLTITQRPRYLDEVRAMIDRFDQGIGGAGRNLEVYYLQHADASVVAEVLSSLYGERDSATAGLPPAADDLGSPLPPPLNLQAPSEQPAVAEAAVADGGAPFVPPQLAEAASAAQIIADEDNNAILVMATATEHRVIQRAIRKLDIPRRQVLVEATIAEVTLTDNLQYGVQWFLDGKIGEFDSRTSLFSGNTAALSTSVAPGFSFSLTNRAGVVRALFDLLANESKLKILSSPQVMVIDNQTANIRVGDQIPVITRSTSSITDPDAPIVNEVQFRDTGVLLQVTPQINAGGMVTLEISQEVSTPSADEFAAGNVSILQRTITSSVSVQSGETVVLGGLIRENKTETLTGIPGLSKIPVLGKLFSRTVDDTSRTELVVTITPRVITDRSTAREAGQELMRRMRGLTAREVPARRSQPPRDEADTGSF
ncbi:MAG: type II secretion system secretin GspD [Gammaproteobacteria bacterium]|nr:type II secretion system secretin GspD [Gammaproteobacteria bacterium]